MSKEELAIVWKLRRVLSGLDGQQALELLLERLKKSPDQHRVPDAGPEDARRRRGSGEHCRGLTPTELVARSLSVTSNCSLAPVHVPASAQATRRPREDTMKKDIHPEYVETQVTCTCGSTFTTRSTATVRHHPRRRLLAVPPVLHRQAEDPRHRRPRRPLRGPLRQEGCRQEVQTPEQPARPSAGPAPRAGPALVSFVTTHVRTGGAPMFEAVEGLLAEHAELEARLAAPETHADARLAKRLNQRYAELSRDHRRLARVAAARRRPRGRPRAGRRGPDFADEAEPLARAARRGRGAAAPAAGAARPDRRQGRDPRGEVGGGRRGVRAVRRRPAAHVHPVRRARAAGRSRSSTPPSPTSAATSRVTVAVKAQGHPRAGRGAVRAAEVRGRRAPRAAGAGHRVAGPGAHQRRRRAGAARGRAGRRRDRRQRPAHRRLPQQRPGRPERQHHRLRGPDHPPADRHRGQLPEREEPAAEQGAGDADPAGPAARRGPGGGRRRGRARPAAARSAPSTAPSGSAPTTSRRTGSPTTAPATSPTTSTRCSTATSQPVLDSCVEADLAARLEALEQ